MTQHKEVKKEEDNGIKNPNEQNNQQSSLRTYWHMLVKMLQREISL